MKTSKFLSNYVKVKDVKAPLTITISSAESEDFKNQKTGEPESKIVVYAKELEQGIVTCKTSIAQLNKLFNTDDTDDWVGKKVVLWVDPNVLMSGVPVGGLRFKAV